MFDDEPAGEPFLTDQREMQRLRRDELNGLYNDTLQQTMHKPLPTVTPITNTQGIILNITEYISNFFLGFGNVRHDQLNCRGIAFRRS